MCYFRVPLVPPFFFYNMGAQNVARTSWTWLSGHWYIGNLTYRTAGVQSGGMPGSKIGPAISWGNSLLDQPSFTQLLAQLR
jgi:uncharacterized protein affecting Mg2+/Co2+ transport